VWGDYPSESTLNERVPKIGRLWDEVPEAAPVQRSKEEKKENHDGRFAPWLWGKMMK
jgi:hypothetical protein